MKFYLFLILSFVLGVITSLYSAREYPELLMPNLDQALQECISEIENGCPMLLGYAISLEKENGRLNRVLKTNCLCGEKPTH